MDSDTPTTERPNLTVLTFPGVTKETDPDEPYVPAAEDVDLEDIAFFAKRLVVTALTKIDWADLSEGGNLLLDDEGDQRILKQFLRTVEVSVTIPGFEDEL